MLSFSQASYLSQVRRLRDLATEVLHRFPIKVKNLVFINHGENATFRVDVKNGKRYLLRIHRSGYHTPEAIQQELDWLAHLANEKLLTAPRPITSKFGNFVEQSSTAEISEPRCCCLFDWVDGHFIYKSLNSAHMFELGKALGTLQRSSARIPSSHRVYWTADGLLGDKPKFGSLDAIEGIPSTQQLVITKARRRLLTKLKKFETKFPQKQGLVHADAHFGNVLKTPTSVGLIDFDDCGYGFYAYDLAVPLIAAQHILQKRDPSVLNDCRQALISGYSTASPWERVDHEILDTLIDARRLTMLGWLNSRSDNPRLKKLLKSRVSATLKELGLR